jgi:creatinine deaminase
MRVSSQAPFRHPPCTNVSSEDEAHLEHAIAQASLGLDEGGVPIGAALVITAGERKGEVLGVGRNKRVQLNSATRHGEVRRLPAELRPHTSRSFAPS